MVIMYAQLNSNEPPMYNGIWNFVVTSGQVAIPSMGGVALGAAIVAPPSDLISWIIGPAGVLVLLTTISWYLWKHAKMKQEEVDKLRDKIEADQAKRIEELQRKVDEK